MKICYSYRESELDSQHSHVSSQPFVSGNLILSNTLINMQAKHSYVDKKS